jgi:glycosyltransferase involved in cell wall biosynthesis
VSALQPENGDVIGPAAGKKRIVFFMSSLAGGGAERVVLSLAAEYVKRGHQADVLVVTRRGELVSEVPESVNVVELGAGGLVSALGALLQLPFSTFGRVLPTMITRRRKKIRGLPRLATYLRQQQPDVLLATTEVANLISLWAGRLARADTRLFVKSDISMRTWAANTSDALHRRLPRLVAAWYPRARGIVCVSAGLAEELGEMTDVERARIHVIYNPVDCRRIAELAAQKLDHPWFQPGQPPVVLAAGRLHRQKDYPTLLQAFARLRRRQACRLVIIGEGPERGRLASLAAQLGISEDVQLPGFQTNPFAYMARAGVFVLSSAWEGLSNVLIEALACGCPVVSTDCPHGPAEVLDGGKYGTLVPVANPAALAQALQATLDRKTGAAEAQQRAGYFDIGVVADRYWQLFFASDTPKISPDRQSGR